MLSLLTDYSETTVEYDDVRQTLLGWSQGGCSTVWSEVLPRIICRQGESMLGGCSVLELGAGCGLLGLLAGNWASRVDITDGDEEEVALIATNIEQHAPAGAELHAAFLDWQHPEDAAAQLLGKEAYDVVLASQVAYMPTFIPGLARTIRYYLSPAGTAYLYNDQVALHGTTQAECRALLDRALLAEGLHAQAVRLECDGGGGAGGAGALELPPEAAQEMRKRSASYLLRIQRAGGAG